MSPKLWSQTLKTKLSTELDGLKNVYCVASRANFIVPTGQEKRGFRFHVKTWAVCMVSVVIAAEPEPLFEIEIHAYFVV